MAKAIHEQEAKRIANAALSRQREFTHKLFCYFWEDKMITLSVAVENETVWLNQNQMIELFGRDQSVISRHIRNVFKEQEVDEKSNMHFLHIANSDKPVAYYSLDVIISVGYRVKSKRGVEFRRWANSVLKQYILKGYAVNDNRIRQLGEVIRIMKRTENELDSKQVLSVIEKYSSALYLLDSYDHQNMARPEGNRATYMLSYEECMDVIQSMRFGDESDLFGKEKDDSYSFFDGNKRIAATMFLYFLDKNEALFVDGQKKIEDATLVALTIMIAESRPEEKEMMISVVMNCML